MTSRVRLVRLAVRPWILPAGLAVLLIVGVAGDFLFNGLSAPRRANVPINEGALAPPPSNQAAAPWVAVIVVGVLRLSDQDLQAAVDLPAPVGMALSAYATDFGNWQSKARAAGHETYLQLPLASADPEHIDSGPKALAVTMPEPELQQRLTELLDPAGDIVGAVADAGAFGSKAKRFAPIARTLALRNVGLIELSGAHLDNVAAEAALRFELTAGPWTATCPRKARCRAGGTRG